MTPREAAKYLKVSPRTLYRLIETEGLPSTKLAEGRTGTVRIRRAWLDQWMEERRR